MQPKRHGAAGPIDRVSSLSATERQLYDALVSGEAWLRQRPLDGHWLVGRKAPAGSENDIVALFDYVGEDIVSALMDRQLVDRYGRPVADRQLGAPRGANGCRQDVLPRQETYLGIAAE